MGEEWRDFVEVRQKAGHDTLCFHFVQLIFVFSCFFLHKK